MKEENNSSAGVWASAVAGLLLLYILSPGPVLLYYQKTRQIQPKWLEKTYYPLEKLYDKSSTVKSFYDFYFRVIGIKK